MKGYLTFYRAQELIYIQYLDSTEEEIKDRN